MPFGASPPAPPSDFDAFMVTRNVGGGEQGNSMTAPDGKLRSAASAVHAVEGLAYVATA